MTIKNKHWKKMLILIPSISLFTISSCSFTTTENPRYNLVSPDYQMSESLAILGYTPSLVTSAWTKAEHNDFATQEMENIAYAPNDERLLVDKPKIFLSFGLNEAMKQKVESYGGKYLPYPKEGIKDYFDYDNIQNNEKMPLIFGWASVKAFWKELNNLFVDQLIPNYVEKLDLLEKEFNLKVKNLYDAIIAKYGFKNDQKIKMTMWGAGVGIEYDVEEKEYDRYGYDTGQIDWMFGENNSLNFEKTKPLGNDIVYKLGKTPSQITVQGWFEASTEIPTPQKGVQKHFFVGKDENYKGSDLVFVKYNLKNNDSDAIEIKKIKEHFSQMVNPTSGKLSAEDRVIIVPTNLEFYQYSPISWEYCLNTLAKAMGIEDGKDNKIYTDLNSHKQNLKSFKDVKLNLKK